jgi:hypothetical protein
MKLKGFRIPGSRLPMSAYDAGKRNVGKRALRGMQLPYGGSNGWPTGTSLSQILPGSCRGQGNESRRRLEKESH